MILDADRRRDLPRPADDHIGLVSSAEDVEVLRVPRVASWRLMLGVTYVLVLHTAALDL
jgi:hypothetical protein